MPDTPSHTPLTQLTHLMHAPFNPQELEASAQKNWTSRDAYQVHEHSGKPLGKFYACSMLPYPSGKLHMGHVRNYTINDMLTRQLRMKGYNVLMPMGWDAFGLPAENAALKNGRSPAQWTHENIAYMKGQMQAMGLAIDWSREIATCEPSYYKWSQWLFLKMLAKGIAYRKTQLVNWDPVDQTVLANEQVIDGRGWRTGALIEKREIPGYYLDISRYAQELLDHVQIGNDKATLHDWPDKVRLMQENWIGKSQGVRFAFTHDIRDTQGGEGGEGGPCIQEGKLYVFTTRADTLMGVTFCAVAPQHPLAEHAARTQPDVAAFIEACQQGGTTEAEWALKEKEGRPLHLSVRHPLTDEPIPVWVSNYVLMGYGDGAVMGVPAHDERDFVFALKYQLPIKPVVSVKGQTFDPQTWQPWYSDKQDGVCMHSGPLDGLSHAAAVDKVAALLQAKGLGEKKTTWRLRDWSISRQRYWGTPIPIIHCTSCGAVPVPEKDLPVVLPQDCIPDGSGNPLNQHEGFHAGVTCPSCGQPARRETDTMDTFVDSSWYFLRYCNPHNTEAVVDATTHYWMQGGMDQYIGGIEHAILHLLYARFWIKVMRDLGLIPIDEPFKRLLCQGMVLNHIYTTKNDKGGDEFFWPHDVEPTCDASGKVIGATLKNAVGSYAAGTPIRYGGMSTMSKSKNNGVDPQELIEKYGADTARLYTMFTAPPEATLEWNETAVEGAHRFLRRVWHFCCAQAEHIQKELSLTLIPSLTPSDNKNTPRCEPSEQLRREVHSLLGQANYDYERLQYNTVVSAAMKLLNLLERALAAQAKPHSAAMTEGISILLRVLYPVCPHTTFVLWEQLGFAKSQGDLLDAPWPEVDAAALVSDEIELVVQLNGKHKGSLRVPAQANKAQIDERARAHAMEKLGLAPDRIARVVVVPGRLVNVVIA